MKENELSIGDLFYRPACNDKVKEIRKNGVIGIDSLRGVISFNEIKPIPITAEILEKNGFVPRITLYHTTVYEYSDDYYDLVIKEYNDGTWLVTYHCTEMDMPTEEVLVCYVHRLQHALRLYGIDKEIVI